MKQALEKALGSLRLAIQTWLRRAGWRRDSPAPDSQTLESQTLASQTSAGQRLARDLGLPATEVSNILDHAVADLHELSDEDGDPWPIIDRAVHQIDELGAHDDPAEDAVVSGYLRQLPERDRQILSLFNDGKKHSEIARLMGTDSDSVCNSLVASYTSLRLRMADPGGDSPSSPRRAMGPGNSMEPVKVDLQHRTL